MGNSNIVDLEMVLHHQTDRAALVSEDEDNAVWLPLSQIELEESGSTCTVTLPQWLAETKGLVWW